METLLAVIALASVGTGIIGWLWITVMAFSEEETGWGIGCLIISPLCLVYALLNFQELKIPFLLVLGGLVGRLAVGMIAASMG